MKKFLLLISLFIFSIVPVKAEETYTLNIDIYDFSKPFCGTGGCNLTLEQAYNQVMNIYNTQYKTDNTAYHIVLWPNTDNNSIISYNLELDYYNKNSITYTYSSTGLGIETNSSYHFITYYDNTNDWEHFSPSGSFGQNILIGTKDNYYYNLYSYFDSSWNYEVQTYNYIFNGFYNSNDTIQLNIGDTIPKAKDLFNYSSWSDYTNNYNQDSYTTVNLDNYEYVLLSLKNYTQLNAFQTNLLVKGQIGITPIYNYGQSSYDSITGIQVQDRCNAPYENYTTYPFYILQTDLQNNVVYAVKSCSSNSSFQFNNSIFNISYVTQSNLNNPTVTINGNTYNVIPYADLPSTATKNEIDNYIPGESSNIINSNTDGLNSAIKNAQSSLANIWSTFTYFTSFVTQIFTSLPPELHAILLTAFTLTIIIGLIKHFTG